jgi:hypothetical protein
VALKRNWFVYLTLGLLEICTVFTLFSIITDMADEKTYPFLWYSGIICALAVALALIHIASKYTARLKLIVILSPRERKSMITERIIVSAVILASAVIRIWVIAKIPITPASDYQTYYQVADLLSKGTLSSSGYSGYIAEFPHVIGFPFVLSLLFKITGPSFSAGLYLNMAASLLSVYLTYRIARTLCGRLAGMLSLFAAAFWPSQILYGTILASEPIFTCLLLLCIRLFIYFFKYPVLLENREGSMFLCFALGVLIALANAIRPLSAIFLIAVLICTVPFSKRFNKNEKMLNGKLSRASCQGWFMAMLIFFSFFICNLFISASISNAIAYKLPGTGVSFGYNLMVGVNTDAKGAWNQQDADYFANTFAATNSPEAAHKASVDVALARIGSDPVGVLNLAMEKFTLLWKNDDYAQTWTALFLSQQGTLTPERQHLINQFTHLNDYFYLLSIFFSAIFGFKLFKRKCAGPVQALILLYLGTVFLHMFLESQNRYHYFILPILIILASMGIAGIYRDYSRNKAKEPDAPAVK